MSYNLRDIDIEYTCLNCKFFQSYKNYYKDEGEPIDCGICVFQGNNTVSNLTICDNHTNKDKL